MNVVPALSPSAATPVDILQRTIEGNGGGAHLHTRPDVRMYRP